MKRTTIAIVWHRFRADRRGAVAIIVALSILGLVGTAGLGIDYYNALAAKSRLDLASDAAAIAAINAAQSYIAANSGSQTDPTLTAGAITAGKAQAQKVFYSNAGSTANIATTPGVTMSRSGQTFNANISYQAASQNAFGPMFGVKQFNLVGGSASSLTMGKYLDFYLLLDVSGSMGLPTTNQGQQQLAAISPDQKDQYPSGCAFACHFSQKMCSTIQYPQKVGPPQTCQGYNLARSNNIELRADSVGKAVQALLSTATATETITNQFRVGLYPFIVHAGTLYAISNNLNGAQTSAGTLGTLLDTGQSTTPYGSGGTHFENAIPELNSLITTIGDGSGALKPQPFVFLVTDGADNSQTYTTSSNKWCCLTGSPAANSAPQNMDPTLCTALKSRGITVSVLYIPYPPINPPNPKFAGDEDDKVNAIIPTIPSKLQACASPGFYFSAYTPQDITNAMQAMFQQSLAAARLTQ
ncbi:MAG: TadE/TadG family type IV pilus assembly protein [Methylocella sp.]